MRPQEGVDRAVAVGVEVERDPEVVDLLDRLVDHVLRERQLAAPVLLAAGAAGPVRRGEEGGPALGRPVDRDLDTSDLEVTVVLAPAGHGELDEDLVHVRDERVGHDVDEVCPGVRGTLDRLQLRQVRRALMGGGDAGLGVHEVRRLRPLDLLIRREGRRLLEHGEERGLHDQAPGFVGAGLADDDAAGGRLRPGVEPELLQGQAVQHGTVHRHVVDAHRVVGERLVQVVAVEETAIRHDGVVVAVARDHLALRDLVLLDEPPDLGDDAVHVLARPGRRRVQLDLPGHRQRVDVVAVGVEEARQQRLAAEVHDLRRRALVGLLDVGLCPDREDLPVLDGQRLRGGLSVVDGDDVAARVDGVGRPTRRRPGWRAGRRHGQCDRGDRDVRLAALGLHLPAFLLSIPGPLTSGQSNCVQTELLETLLEVLP